jgi:hypothetical protein|tara:strand:+ start:585 stop:1772 length:1188 start_codon:yes stop_codon:yes gene_type:complete
MAETEKQVAEMTAPDAPKKNAVAAETSPLKNDAEDLGSAVVKPTDSNPDATKKVKPVSGDAQQKNAGAADPMPSVKKEEAEDADGKEISEGEMPDGLKKYLDKKKEKSETSDKEKTEEGYKMKKETSHEDEKKMKSEKSEDDQKAKDVDVKEHIDALTSGESDLSEEFKQKAATIFEAAITSKVKAISEEMQADYNKKFDEEVSKAKTDLVEKVDAYMNYVVNEWMKENELAIEKGIKGEIAEDFINGLKKLFEDHYIDVPDEKYDVLEDQASKIEELEKKLNEQISKNVEMNKENASLKRTDIIAEVASDLADTSKEKFAKLTEEVEYSNADDFKKKCETIKESYFGNKKEANSDSEVDNAVADNQGVNTEDLSNAMAAYTTAISKTKDIKLSN